MARAVEAATLEDAGMIRSQQVPTNPARFGATVIATREPSIALEHARCTILDDEIGKNAVVAMTDADASLRSADRSDYTVVAVDRKSVEHKRRIDDIAGAFLIVPTVTRVEHDGQRTPGEQLRLGIACPADGDVLPPKIERAADDGNAGGQFEDAVVDRAGSGDCPLERVRIVGHTVEKAP